LEEVEPMYELRGSWTIWESVQFEKAKRWMNLKE
jgi:hypothetical protein